ncbi:MAG: hypothetical protein QOD86_2145 [Miltoncostaeaceae bacterium]|nr:hypothetical protein [Miltoncostaeaceae bacterium]
MTAALLDALAVATGSRVERAEAVAGGDVNRALRAELADGRTVFVKHRDGAPAGMYRAEADGLRWLAEAGAIRIPEVVAVADDAEPRLLALEWIDRGARGPDHDERLGHGLAALHRFGASCFGLAEDNFIADIPQPNAPLSTWAAFHAERRVLHLGRRAVDAGLLPAGAGAKLERLAARMPELCGPEETPARLHGDLWSGNAIADRAGAPVLVDPAVYGGHREVDLAMMRLFGGFSERVFAAYDDAFPLAPGHEERVDLHQLTPLLVHVLLFGGSYVRQTMRAVERYL